MATIEQITSTSFTEMIGVANNTNTISINSADHTQVKLMNRYSNFVESDPAILNTDYINEALTHIWTTRNSNNDSFGWCVDQVTAGESNRGALDRFVWSGSILSNNSTGETWLSSHVVSGQDLQTSDPEDEETEYETDGLVIIPQPNCELTLTKQTADNDVKQMAVKVKVKFNDLPAYKWVPLFGYTTCLQGASEAGANIGKSIHVSKSEHIGYRTPIAIATSENNILGINPISNCNFDHSSEARHGWDSNSPYALPVAAANLTTYFMYCHDGAGNGMLATCAGELPVPVGNTSLFTGYPRNEHFNVHDGITKWSAPPAIDANEPLFSDPAQRDLQALWQKYGGDGQDRADGAQDYKKLFRIWYKYWREDFKSRSAIANSGSFLANTNSITTDKNGQAAAYGPLWNTTQLQARNDITYRRYYYQHRDLTFASSYVTSLISPNQFEDEWGDIIMLASDYVRTDNPNSTVNDADKYMMGFGPICWNYGQLIAYGPTINSDLSTETELHLNVTRTIGDKNMLIGSGIYSDDQPDSLNNSRYLEHSPADGPGRGGLYAFNNLDRIGDTNGDLRTGYAGTPSGPNLNRYGISRRPIQLFWTGKMLDFTFRDALGPVCYTNQRYEWRANVSRLSGTVEGDGTSQEYGQLIDGLILRSVPGCKLYSGTFGSYAKTGTDQGYPSTVQNNSNIRPGNNTELAFTSEGLSYGPIVNARVDPDKHQAASGVRMDSLSDPAWTDVPNLFDSDTNTVAVVKDAGENNALYIEMNGVINPNQPVPDDEREIETFTLALRGLRQLSLTRHRIKLAIVDNTKTNTLFVTGDETNPDIIVEVNNTVSFPSGGQAYTFTIDTTGLTYGQVKNGFVKIWTEAVV